MEKKELLEMKLHEECVVNKYYSVLRVFGGWIYNQMLENQDGIWTSTSTFVPEVLDCEVIMKS